MRSMPSAIPAPSFGTSSTTDTSVQSLVPVTERLLMLSRASTPPLPSTRIQRPAPPLAGTSRVLMYAEKRTRLPR